MYYTYKEAAQYLNISYDSIRSLIGNKKLKKDHKKGHICFISKEELDNYKEYRYSTNRTKWNYDFFKQDNPLTAYWAGFIMADGFIQNRKNSFRLGINLANTDRKHLLQYANDIGLSKNKGILNILSTRPNRQNSTRISVSHPDLGKDLKRWGIIPRKTYNFIEPTFPINLLGPYLRGWIDGDGTIDDARNYIRIRLFGNNEAMVWLKEKITKEILYEGPISHCQYNKKYQLNEISFSCGKPENLSFLYNFMMADHSPRLNRKWSKVDKYYNRLQYLS